MMDHESEFSTKEQAKTIRDAKEFVKYMASPDLYNLLDMDSTVPLEGFGTDRNLRMHTTRMITEHINEMINKTLGIDLYEKEDVSSCYGDDDNSEPFESRYTEFHRRASETKKNFATQLLPAKPITEQDLKREIHTIRYEGSQLRMKILIENYVYVTYLSDNSADPKPYKFNLLDMQAKTLQFGTQHSKNKFSKNDLRYRWGSHLIFSMGILVETGSTSPVIAAKLLEHTLNVFEKECDYKNIMIRERKCHNVVATGILNDGICLELLKKRYPYVKYDKGKFLGAIIRIADIVDNHNGLQDFTNYEREGGYNDPEDEYDRLYNNRTSEKDAARLNGDDGEYEVDYDVFDLYNKKASSSSTTTTPKEKKVTALVFNVGQAICVGNTSRKGVLASFHLLYPILESCRATPENMKLEKQIIQAKRYKYTKKQEKKSNKKRARQEHNDGDECVKKRASPEHDDDDDDDEREAKKRRVEEEFIPCVSCEFKAKRNDFEVVHNNIVSPGAMLCVDCEHCVCDACYRENYVDHPRDLKDEFVCLDCRVSSIK